MKTIYLLVFIIFGSTTFMHAQNDDKHARIKALKVSFFTEELELTPAEAEKFWPIYNMYDDRQQTLRREERRMLKEKYESREVKKKLSEAAAKKLISEFEVIMEEKMKVEKELMSKLLEKMPASKVVFLPEVERRFGQRLFEEFKRRKEKN